MYLFTVLILKKIMIKNTTEWQQQDAQRTLDAARQQLTWLTGFCSFGPPLFLPKQ